MLELTTQKKGLCGIEIGPEGIAVAYSPNPSNLEITVCDFQPYSTHTSSPLNSEALREYLTQIVTRHSLSKVQCSWVLHPDYYRLTLINAPNVPQDEYKKAVRWQIKDIVNFPLEDVTIDIFYPDEYETTHKKIYVIAAQTSFLQKTVETIQKCHLIPVAIDVREFAMRNLLVCLAQEKEAVAFLNLTNESCLLTVVKQQNIQFVRRIPVGLKNMLLNNSDLNAELDRSFKYSQTELKQEVPSRIFMSPTKEINSSIIKNIASSLNKEVAIINLRSIIAPKMAINSELESSCWVAVGGGLRNVIMQR